MLGLFNRSFLTGTFEFEKWLISKTTSKSEGWPATSMIEIMAHGIGAFAGIQALEAEEPVRLSFLLGTRKLELFADSLLIGKQMKVVANLSIQNPGGMGVFDCELHWTDASDDAYASLPADGLVVKASLNVYSPKDGKVV